MIELLLLLTVIISPFANDDTVDCDHEQDSLGKSLKMKENTGVGVVSDEGLTSIVHTTLHGDCRPVMEYGLVS